MLPTIKYINLSIYICKGFVNICLISDIFYAKDSYSRYFPVDYECCSRIFSCFIKFQSIIGYTHITPRIHIYKHLISINMKTKSTTINTNHQATSPNQNLFFFSFEKGHILFYFMISYFQTTI